MISNASCTYEDLYASGIFAKSWISEDNIDISSTNGQKSLDVWWPFSRGIFKVIDIISFLNRQGCMCKKYNVDFEDENMYSVSILLDSPNL